MYVRDKKLMYPLLVLLLAAMACSLANPKVDLPQTEAPPVAASATTEPTNIAAPEDPTSTATTMPTESPTATSEARVQTLPTLPAPQDGPETLNLDGLPKESGFSDFTESVRMAMNWTGPDDSPQTASTDYTYRKQTIPTTSWFLLYEDNNPFIASKVETAVIDQQAFSSTPETGCQAVGVEKVQDVDPNQAFLNMLEALTGEASRTEAAVMLGDQPTDVYTLESANIKPGSEVVMETKYADSSGEFSSSVSSSIKLEGEGMTMESGKLYLARQGGYVMQIELKFSGTAGEDESLFAKPGSRMERTIIYKNLVATTIGEAIAAPAGCGASPTGSGIVESGGSPAVSISDIPRPEGITNVVEVEDSLIYQSSMSLDELVDFYRSEMEALGWELGDNISMATLATLDFTRGDQTLSVSIVQSGNTLMVTVDLS